MEVKVLSDLHLEFEKIDSPIYDPGTGEVLILAGDIFTVIDLIEDGFGFRERFLTFLDKCSQGYNQVFYVMGNHEFYHMQIDRAAKTLREWLPANITLLDDSSVYYNGVHFFGATVWADFCSACPEMMNTAEDRMNDYEVIMGPKGRELLPEDTLQKHQDSVKWFKQVLPTLRGPVVMVTHHAPSYKSVAPEFLHTGTVGAYASDLEPIMYEHDNIVAWCHGHVHDTNDYMVNNTRVIGNPRGYVTKNGTNGNFNPDFTFSV